MQKQIADPVLTDTLIGGMVSSLELGRLEAKKDWQMWLRMPSEFTDSAVAAAGLDKQQLLRKSNYPFTRISTSPEILDLLDSRGIYRVKGLAVKPDDFYYFELIDTRLFVRYQQIIGSWLVCELHEGWMTELKARLIELLKEWQA